MYPTGTKYDHPSILMEREHDVQLPPCHPDLTLHHADVSMGFIL
jgi:hypothetical protein